MKDIINLRHGLALKLRGWILGKLRPHTHETVADFLCRDVRVQWQEIEHEKMGYVGYQDNLHSPYFMLNVSMGYGDLDYDMHTSLNSRDVFTEIFSGGYMPDQVETKDGWGCCPISNGHLWQFLKAEAYLRANFLNYTTAHYTNVLMVGLDCSIHQEESMDKNYKLTGVLFKRASGCLHYFIIRTEDLFEMPLATLLNSVESYHLDLRVKHSGLWRSYSSTVDISVTPRDSDCDYYGKFNICSSGYEYDWREFISCFDLHMPHWFEVEHFLAMLISRYGLKADQDQDFLLTALQQRRQIWRLRERIRRLEEGSPKGTPDF
jgi:hypothetical protein